MSTHDYFGIQLSVTAKVNLFTALAAVDALIPPTVRELTIQIDAGSDASTTLLIGDASVSTSRYGVALVRSTTAPPFKQYGAGSDVQSVPLKSIFLLNTGGTTVKVNVEGFTG